MCYTHLMKNLDEPLDSAKAVCLCLEASADSASACIVINGECKSEAINIARHGHSETLVGLIEQVIANTNLGAQQQDMIIAGCGPGSFTGLRVCLATAHGYQLATNANAVGISALVALALDGLSTPDNNADLFISYCDSRRNSLFVQVFDSHLRALSQIEDIPMADFNDFLDSWKKSSKNITLCGDSAGLAELSIAGVFSHHAVMTAKLLGNVFTAKSGYLDIYPEYCLPLVPLYVHPAYVTSK